MYGYVSTENNLDCQKDVETNSFDTHYCDLHAVTKSYRLNVGISPLALVISMRYYVEYGGAPL